MRGGTEAYLAWSEEPLPRGTAVLVFNSRGGRAVDVMQWSDPLEGPIGGGTVPTPKGEVMLGYRVPAPDEAMLISGGKAGRDGAPFRVVTGHGAFVMPFFRQVRFLTLAMREAEVAEQCVTKQGIALQARAVIAFKVGNDPESIVNAGQRFLSDQDQMSVLTGRIFAGHLRSIVGSMTVEEIVREAAGGLANANINVLNGADGLGQIAAGLVGQGLTIFDSIKQNLTDGDVEWPPDEPAANTTDGDARAVPENAA